MRPSSKSVRDRDEGANVAFMLTSNQPPEYSACLAMSLVQRHTPVKHFAGSAPSKSPTKGHFSCNTGWWPRAQVSSKHVDKFVFLALPWAHATARVTDSMFGAKTSTQLTGPNGTGCNAKPADPGQAKTKSSTIDAPAPSRNFTTRLPLKLVLLGDRLKVRPATSPKGLHAHERPHGAKVRRWLLLAPRPGTQHLQAMWADQKSAAHATVA